MIDNGYRNFGDGFNKYLKSIEKIPLLSADEEKELSIIIQDSSSNEDVISSAIDKLVESNLLLVVKFAINYYNFISKGEFELSIMDFISEGNLALFRAAGTFDYEKGRFSTYASHYIKRHLQNTRHNNRFIRLPINYFTIVNMAKKLQGDKEELSSKDIDKIAKSQDTTVKHVNFVLECYRKKVVSIDQPSPTADSYDGDDQNNSFMDTYASNEKSFEDIASEQENNAYLAEKIATLSDMEQKILIAKYFSDSTVTCQELAEVWDVSKQRISQILIGVLKKLRKKINEDKKLGKFKNTKNNS